MIYVDPLVDRGWRYGPNCHMATDDQSAAGLDALHAFAARLGLQRSYFQPPKYPRAIPHYDLNTTKRALALRLGAVALEPRAFIRACKPEAGMPFSPIQQERTDR